MSQRSVAVLSGTPDKCEQMVIYMCMLAHGLGE
jgi:hypothetical protein